MKIAVDANVLVRAVMQDDIEQARIATRMLEEASLIAVSLPCLCELVWVLLRGAELPKEQVAAAIRSLLDAGNVAMNRPGAEAGLSMLLVGRRLRRWRDGLRRLLARRGNVCFFRQEGGFAARSARSASDAVVNGSGRVPVDRQLGKGKP